MRKSSAVRAAAARVDGDTRGGHPPRCEGAIDDYARGRIRAYEAAKREGDNPYKSLKHLTGRNGGRV